MKISDELKSITNHEIKSGYHKARLIAAVGEKGLKFIKNSTVFLSKYVKELKRK